MRLSWIQQLLGWVDKLSPRCKTIIIVLLCILVMREYVINHTETVLHDYTNLEQAEKRRAEEYTQTVAPELGRRVQQILQADKDASNVILLNYHNGHNSSSGFSYYYMTALAIRFRGADNQSYRRVWEELSYTHYGDEIERIRANGMLRADSLSQIRKSYPMLSELFTECKATSVACYPIEGASKPLGMIIILYQKPKQYSLGYYPSIVAPQIQAFSSLLDYDTVKLRLNEN